MSRIQMTPMPCWRPLSLAVALAVGGIAPLAHADRAWTYTYNSQGLVASADGPRTDLSDVTRYTYDADGNLATVTNALGQVTTLSDYDALGLPGKVVDPNGVVTLLTYNGRGQVISRSVQTVDGNATTTYAYDAIGQLTNMTLPGGQTLSYSYDGAHRLISVKNNLGQQIDYSRDPMGDITQTQIHDSAGNLVRTQSRAFDELGRLIKAIDALGHTTTFQYDPNGNQTGRTDANGNATSRAFDALNRLITQTDAANGKTHYGYDPEDNLTSVTDPRGLKTTYTYDYAGDKTSIQSPDTGKTTFSYDSAGNVIQKTDARGVVTQYRYDALNRVTDTRYPADPSEDVHYTYDETDGGLSDGIGRLTTITDQTGSTHYTYDQLGDVSSVTSKVEKQVSATQYRYDLAGHLTGMTYPSGRIVTFTLDALGRVQKIATQADSGAPIQTVVDGVTYLPFGPVSQFQYGNGIKRHLTYNQNYQLTQLASGVMDRNYQYDPVGDITDITDNLHASHSQTFQYDALSRLTQAVGHYGQINYTYDADGNRLTRQWNKWRGHGDHDDFFNHWLHHHHGLTETYTYAGDSNHLLQVSTDKHGRDGTRRLSYSANGNLIEDQQGHHRKTMAYNQADRLQEVDHHHRPLAIYEYNALGQRVIKVALKPRANRHFAYDLGGHLLTETTPRGTLLREYIYLGNRPVAMLATDETRRPDIEHGRQDEDHGKSAEHVRCHERNRTPETSRDRGRHDCPAEHPLKKRRSQK